MFREEIVPVAALQQLLSPFKVSFVHQKTTEIHQELVLQLDPGALLKQSISTFMATLAQELERETSCFALTMLLEECAGLLHFCSVRTSPQSYTGYAKGCYTALVVRQRLYPDKEARDGLESRLCELFGRPGGVWEHLLCHRDAGGAEEQG